MNYLILAGALIVVILISGSFFWIVNHRSWSGLIKFFACSSYFIIAAFLLFRWSSEFNDGEGDVEEYALVAAGAFGWILFFVDFKRSKRETP